MAQSIVIFGASGDLTSRKLVPALYELHRKQRLPEQARIIGFSRSPFSDDDWRQRLAESTARFVGAAFDREVWDSFAPMLSYHPGDIGSLDDFRSLRRSLDEREGAGGTARTYYLATSPAFYEPAIGHLGAAGLTDTQSANRRIVVEKPFGVDWGSAHHLNDVLHTFFSEPQIYRIDHYLGKETVQNVLVMRFANAIFEPIWNRNYVDHVEITAAEELAVGHRAGYYDSAGVLRDMVQNHLIQLLTFAAMEPPALYDADSVRDEKVKVLRAIRPMSPQQVATDTLRGQYRSYRDEPGVAAGSRTATFAAIKLMIDNWRWQGVPFFLRSGKAMACPTTQIVIQFRQPPHLLFAGGPQSSHDANRLVIQIQPAEGVQLHFQTKVPDAEMHLRLTDLSFRFRDKFAAAIPDAYQRLLLDVMHGDPSLFARSDAVELAWDIIDPIQKTWDKEDVPELFPYETGEWGPRASTDWIYGQGHTWFDACPVLH